MVRPAEKRELAGRLHREYGFSQRCACRLARISRSSARYAPRGRDGGALRKRMRELAAMYPRYGHPLFTGFIEAARRKKAGTSP